MATICIRAEANPICANVKNMAVNAYESSGTCLISRQPSGVSVARLVCYALFAQIKPKTVRADKTKTINSDPAPNRNFTNDRTQIN